MEWYYAIDGQRKGPISQADLDQLAARGEITSATLVWRQGMAEWQAYGTLAGGPSDETAVCAFSGKTYPKGQMVHYEGRWIAAEHRDEYFQHLREGVAIPGQFVYGGFWIRFGAKFLDGLIIGVVGVTINFFVMRKIFFGSLALNQTRVSPQALLEYNVVTTLINLALGLSYAIFFISRYSATPGKMAVGLKLVRADGSPLGVGRIVGRHFAEILSYIILAVGYIMAAFDDEKRALHDRICDTRVIRAK